MIVKKEQLYQGTLICTAGAVVSDVIDKPGDGTGCQPDRFLGIGIPQKIEMHLSRFDLNLVIGMPYIKQIPKAIF